MSDLSYQRGYGEGYEAGADDLHKAIAEIERLQAENKEHLRLKNELVLKAYPAMDERDELLVEVERLRVAENEAIKQLVEMDNKVFDARSNALEEAARVAEEWPPRRWMTTKQLAAAIRALKET